MSENKISKKVKIQRLENQLLTGYKVVYISPVKFTTAPLTDEERKEIKNQIDEMKKRL